VRLLVREVLRDVGREVAYTLHRRGEEDVQQEERRCSDPALDQVPAVVLAADLVASSAPVVERQAQCPQHTECHHVVHSLRLQPVHPSPHGIVDVVDRREDGPHAVDLAPVPVDFGDDEEDGEERKGECEAGDDRVGRGVDVFQGLQVADVGEDLLGQRVQLRDEAQSESVLIMGMAMPAFGATSISAVVACCCLRLVVLVTMDVSGWTCFVV
jgi:hypothetical protein